MLPSHSFVHNAIFVFRLFEPLFWFVQAFIAVNLLNAKLFFGANVKLINKLIKIQGFDVELEPTDKAFNIWRRDLTILFFLNPLIIILIHLI